MIPQILHIVWIGPHDPPTRFIESWRDKNPDWPFQVWTNLQGWQNQHAIDVVRQYSAKADLIRYEILAKVGGIVVDADSEALRALEPEEFLRHQAFACYFNEPSAPGLLSCAAMGGDPSSPLGGKLWRDVLERAGSADVDNMRVSAFDSTGPKFLTQAVAELGGPAAVGMHVYPAHCFIGDHYDGTPCAPPVDPAHAFPYARQFWGATKGYGRLYKWPCWCKECRETAFRPPWG
jgi:mannosyltransferase OCH1-like enzyme